MYKKIEKLQIESFRKLLEKRRKLPAHPTDPTPQPKSIQIQSKEIPLKFAEYLNQM
jgi:hypothetical protein